MIDEFMVARAFCNGCRRPFPIVCPKGDLRAHLKSKGWAVGPGWRVTCPECGRRSE